MNDIGNWLLDNGFTGNLSGVADNRVYGYDVTYTKELQNPTPSNPLLLNPVIVVSRPDTINHNWGDMVEGTYLFHNESVTTIKGLKNLIESRYECKFEELV